MLQAINNYLSLLGWNEGTEQEVYSLDELKQKFSLDRVTKSGAVFDRTKLAWMNGQHLKLLPHDQVCFAVIGSVAGFDHGSSNPCCAHTAAKSSSQTSSNVARSNGLLAFLHAGQACDSTVLVLGLGIMKGHVQLGWFL